MSCELLAMSRALAADSSELEAQKQINGKAKKCRRSP